MRYNKNPNICQENKSRADHFYRRLSFYRMLEAGVEDLQKVSAALGIEVKLLRRWKRAYDPGRGPFGGNLTDRNVCPPPAQSERDKILAAMREQALEGNVQAAKLLLAEYEERPAHQGEVLTVERAIELLREWTTEEVKSKK